ncbi:hypothetical protein QTP70_008032 [Hemibagrus guttatus]|uniref:Ig-like domain-containing protein n=1 Tax=Hemibagrus guttatus TaxID=175788 RepID=A0AAE0UW03_9TELE|nr:hypothetical protein QTP70_008032 [Hemibagrus guttatus]
MVLSHCDNAFDYWGKGTTVTVTSAVQGPPQSLFPLWQCGASEGFVTLGCITRDLASADGLTFSWADGSGKALTDVVQYPAVQANGGYTSVSHARIQATEWDKKNTYTCEVQNSAGKKYATLRKPEVAELDASLLLTAPTQADIDNGTATFICLAENFSPKTYKFKWSQGNKVCPKVYLLPPPEIIDESVTLTCYVKDFYPKEVAVSWLVDDTPVEIVNGYVQATTNVIENNLFSAYSQLIVKAAIWKQGAVFTCRVYHESIEESVLLISRSITSNSNPPTITHLSLNVPSVCNKK